MDTRYDNDSASTFLLTADLTLQRDKCRALIVANENHLASARKTLRSAVATSKRSLSLGLNYSKFMQAIHTSIADIDRGVAIINLVIVSIELAGVSDELAYEVSEYQRYISQISEVKKELCKLKTSIMESREARIDKLKSGRKYLYVAIILLFVILLKIKGILP